MDAHTQDSPFNFRLLYRFVLVSNNNNSNNNITFGFTARSLSGRKRNIETVWDHATSKSSLRCFFSNGTLSLARHGRVFDLWRRSDILLLANRPDPFTPPARRWGRRLLLLFLEEDFEACSLRLPALPCSRGITLFSSGIPLPLLLGFTGRINRLLVTASPGGEHVSLWV